MSLFSRRNFLIVFASVSVLGGCGFTPIYSDGSAASGLSGTIEIIAGKGRENFEMRERLVERFGFLDLGHKSLGNRLSRLVVNEVVVDDSIRRKPTLQ